MRKFKKLLKKVLTLSIIFLIIFILSFMAFGYLINKFSPTVDVQIEDSSNNTANEESTIDERLKLIQNEDSGTSTEQSNSDELTTEEQSEENIKSEEEEEKKETVREDKREDKQETIKAPIPKAADINKQISNTKQSSTKIFIGYYITLEQAVAAQENIKEQLPNVSPFIKEVNDYYVVQIGAYSNKDSAIEMFNTLKNMNYPVKMKSE